MRDQVHKAKEIDTVDIIPKTITRAETQRRRERYKEKRGDGRGTREEIEDLLFYHPASE